MFAAARNRGNTTGRLVGGLVLLSLVALAAWLVRGRSSGVEGDGVLGGAWNAARVADEPAGFLDACEAQAREILATLAEHESAGNESSSGLRATQGASAASLAELEAASAELKAAFLAAREQNTWPLEWRGKQLNEGGVNEQLQTLAQQLEHERQKLAKLDVSLQGLQQRSETLASIRAKLERQLAAIPSWRTRLDGASGAPQTAELLGVGAELDTARETLERDELVPETP